MTALAGIELESLVSEPDALTTRPPPEHLAVNGQFFLKYRSAWFDFSSLADLFLKS